MSEFKDPDNKPTLASAEQTGTQLPPYRQSDTSSNNQSAKRPLWLIPVLVAVLVIGVVLGRYWGNSAVDARDESVASCGMTSGKAADGNASTEQSVLSVETINPSQEDIGRTLSADGTIHAKETANVSAKVSGVAIERIVVEEGDRVGLLSGSLNSLIIGLYR